MQPPEFWHETIARVAGFIRLKRRVEIWCHRAATVRLGDYFTIFGWEPRVDQVIAGSRGAIASGKLKLALFILGVTFAGLSSFAVCSQIDPKPKFISLT